MTRKSQKYFWIALLAHILLFLCFTLVLTRNPFEIYQPYDARLQQKEFTVLPSYVYQEPTPQQQLTPKLAEVSPKKIETSENGIEKPAPKEQVAIAQPKPKKLISRNVSESSTAEKNSEDPLLRLLYNATSEHLVYPRTARDFRVNGTVHVRFLVSPSGRLTEIKLIKSSGFGYYDDAVIKAITTMSPVKNVDLYLTQPKYVTAIINFS